MLGFNEFHKRWKAFLEKKSVNLDESKRYFNIFCLLLKVTFSVPIRSWYMISVDVLNCFNTVLSDRLMMLLDRILTKVNARF